MELEEVSNIEVYTHNEVCDALEKAIKIVTGSEATSFHPTRGSRIEGSRFIRENLLEIVLQISIVRPDWQEEYTNESQSLGFTQQQVVILFEELKGLLKQRNVRRGRLRHAQIVFNLRQVGGLLMTPEWESALDLIIALSCEKLGIIPESDTIE